MVIRERQNAIRLMMITLYFLFMLPGIFAARRFAFLFSIPHLLVVSGLGILMAFVLLELVEFRLFRYRYRTRRPVVALFLFRVALLILHWILFSSSSLPMRHNPVLSAFLPLLVFYAYFAFPFRFSLPLAVGQVLIPVISGIFGMASGGAGPGPDALSFLLFRAVVSGFFFALAWLWDTERRRDDENQQLMQGLHESEKKLREFAEEVGRTVALEERTRIARDFHDSLGHALTAINIQLSKAKAYLSVNPEEADRAVSAAHETATDAMNDVRDSLGRLNGESGIDLESAVSRLTEQLKRTGHTVGLSFNGSDGDFNYAVLMGLFRCVQEGVTNILKHADATEVVISVELGREQGVVEIRDNGRGCTVRQGISITPSSAEHSAESSASEHYGLRGLRRRLELVGGTVELVSTPGKGTVLRATAPRDPLKLIGQTHGNDTSADS